MDHHALAETFGPCLIPDCPGSVWAAAATVDQVHPQHHVYPPAARMLPSSPWSAAPLSCARIRVRAPEVGIRMSDLAEQCLMTPGEVTRLVQTLVQDRYIERHVGVSVALSRPRRG